jgi:hypothetical protein
MNKNTGIQGAITNGTLVPSPRVWATNSPSPAWLEDVSAAGLEGDCHHQKLEEEVARRPVQEVEPRHASFPAPVRMTNTLDAEGGIEITARLASPHPGAGGHRLG